MKKILVTGAAGFIGRCLCYRLREEAYQVVELTSASGDIADTSTFDHLDGIDFSFVFHLAGRTYVPDAWREPADFQRINVMGTINVLELCRAREIPMTYVSGYAYGIPDRLPIREEDRLVPNNPYAMSKMMAESLCSFYAEFFDVPVTIIRPFNIYGYGQKKHFLIPEIISQVKVGQQIYLENLTPRRDYVYLDDLVYALILTLQHDLGYHVYNIGNGRSLSVAEIVGVIQSVAGTSLPVFSKNHTRQNEISDVYADISKAYKELTWRPRYSFEEGIKKMMVSDGELYR